MEELEPVVDNIEPKLTKAAFNGDISEYKLKLKTKSKCGDDDQLQYTRKTKFYLMNNKLREDPFKIKNSTTVIMVLIR